METLLAGMARFENRLRVERTIGVEKILTRDGYWCRGAPTGFRNARLENKPILLPSEEKGQWDLLCEGLRKQLSGAFKLSDIVSDLQRRGFKTNRGLPISKQTWTNICRSSVYGGLIGGAWNENQYVRANFDGPLSPEEWHELQRVLDGKKRRAAKAPRERHHPDFPLRGFLRCPTCDTPVRGYHVHKRSGETYSYYDCGDRKCQFRLQAHKAHDAFVKLLNQLTLPPELLPLFKEAVQRQWEERTATLRHEWQASETQVTKLKEEKGDLLTLMKRSAAKGSLLGAFEKDYERVDDELDALTSAILKSQQQAGSADQVAERCVRDLRALGNCWAGWSVETQGRVQRLLLSGGLTYEELTGKRVPQVAPVFRQFAHL